MSGFAKVRLIIGILDKPRTASDNHVLLSVGLCERFSLTSAKGRPTVGVDPLAQFRLVLTRDFLVKVDTAPAQSLSKSRG